MSETERFWQLISRHLAGEVSAAEKEELLRMTRQSEEMRIKYEQLNVYWSKSRPSPEVDVAEAYGRVMQQIRAQGDAPARQSRSVIFWVARVAAVVVLGIGVRWYLAPSGARETAWVKLTWQSKETVNGERSKLTLPDGSTVWLNATSQISYPEEFGNDAREIYLTGEAFFDVVRNPRKPFVIHLRNGDVRVLGTSFNVKAFDDDANIETSVVTGKVAFIPQSPDGPADTVLITPNYKAVYTKFSGRIKTEKTNSADDKSWADGRLIFKSQRFEDVAKVLERSYGKSIVFDNEAVKNCRLTGTFQNNTIDEVMLLLSQTSDYIIENKYNTWHVNGEGCTSGADNP